MKLVAISDTHGYHSKVNVGSGDVLIHSGDATGRGQEWEIRSFIEWFSVQDFKHLIFVPGNHEVTLEYNYNEWSKWFREAGITILNEQHTIVSGVSTDDFEDYEYKIYGSPITPNFGRWAYMKSRGEEIARHWAKIPDDTDILITHGPPSMILDEVPKFNGWVDNVGCEELAIRVLDVKPKIHIFGHIHEGAGELSLYGIDFINASQMDGGYNLVHKPIVRKL